MTTNFVISKGASTLFSTLRKCDSIVSNIDLSSNIIDDNCMKELGELIESNEHLNTLSFSENGIGDKGIEILCEYLVGNTGLKAIGMGLNKGITDSSIPFLIEIAKNSYVTDIDISLTFFTDEKKQEIAHAFKIPVHERMIPIKSSSKSAAKSFE